MSDFNLGTVTAYGYAKDKGYTGTEDEYAELMASYADVAEQAAESATQAAASATTATTKASEAAQSATAAASSKTAAETAQGGAETAAQTATTKAGEASTAATTATNKATEATTAATTATGKATEAAGSATTATTKAGEASTSATNAAASATRAQEILDSIPADYSQLSDDVEDLKDGSNANIKLTNIGEQSVRLYSDFVPRAMWDGQVQTYGTYRVTSVGLIEIPSGTKLTIAPDFWIQIAFFENGTYKNSSAWTANSYNFNVDSTVRICIRRITEITTETADIVEFTNAVTFPTRLKKMGLCPVTARTQFDANSKVVLIGDSLVAGYGGTGFDNTSGRKIITYDGNDIYANDNGTCWANMLAGYLRTNYGCTVLNNGLFGFNSVNISQNVATIIPSDATHVISCFGINDRAYNYDTIQNYQKVIDYCNSIGAELVIVSICPTLQPNSTYSHTQYEILSRIKAVCEDNVFEVCDLFGAINNYFYIKELTLNTDYLPDNLHPNDAMYTIMYNLMRGLLHV